MAGAREPILDRMEALLTGLAGLTTTDRNAPLADDATLPAGVQLDGAENTSPDDMMPGRPANAPVRVQLMVQWWITVSDQPEDVGTAISTLHGLAIKTVLTDATLAGIVGKSGSIRYAGAEPFLAEGRQRIKSLMVSFAITYVLIPSQL